MLTPPRRRAFLASLGVAAVLLGLSAADPDGLRKWRRLAREARRIEAENVLLVRENERLRRDVRALQGDPAALEQAAREDLGYVRPGEVVVKLDEEPAPATGR
jgi:cell division protein FtsB